MLIDDTTESRARIKLAFVFVLTTLALPTVCALHSPHALWHCLVQLMLGASAAWSLLWLTEQRLLNPLQSFILITYAWLGLGPCASYLWAEVIGPGRNWLDGDLSSSSPAAALAAGGLPLFAVCAEFTRSKFASAASCPSGISLGSGRALSITLACATTAWLVSMATVAMIRAEGDVPGLYESIGMLGGARTYSWWTGLLSMLGTVGPWALSALAWFFIQPRSLRPAGTLALSAVALCIVTTTAITGGWKSPLVGLAALYTVAKLCQSQRFPWIAGIASLSLFLFVIVPFVSTGRQVAQTLGADSRTRASVFADLATRPQEWTGQVEQMDIAVLFRGISHVGSEAVRRSEALSGPWGGHTVWWGLEALMPRPLFPNKPDLNIGNHIAQTIGADLGMSNPGDEINSLAIFIPCEVSICYGWLAAWASFGVIGVALSSASCILLGARNLAGHPFTPMLALAPLAMEAPLGHFLANARGWLFGLLLFLVIRTVVSATAKDPAANDPRP